MRPGHWILATLHRLNEWVYTWLFETGAYTSWLYLFDSRCEQDWFLLDHPWIKAHRSDGAKMRCIWWRCIWWSISICKNKEFPKLPSSYVICGIMTRKPKLNLRVYRYFDAASAGPTREYHGRQSRLVHYPLPLPCRHRRVCRYVQLWIRAGIVLWPILIVCQNVLSPNLWVNAMTLAKIFKS